jgi:hypothetical protein
MTVYQVVSPGSSSPAADTAAVKAPKRFKLPKLRRVGVVDLGFHRKGHVVVHWNRRVRGHTLKPGRYTLVVQAKRGRKLVGISNAIGFSIKAPRRPTHKPKPGKKTTR